MIRPLPATISGLIKLIGLDHRPHRSVEDGDTALENFL